MKTINLDRGFIQKIINDNLPRVSVIKSRVNSNSGFTLIEVITVVLMIGVLAVILGPNWLSFVNRQRVGKANDAVLAAIQEAQRQAKQKKLNYSVSFKVIDSIPKIVIHPDSEAASSIADSRWQPLGKDVDVQSGQIRLSTNLSSTSKNTAVTSISAVSSTPQTITFDYMGTLPGQYFRELPLGSSEIAGLRIVVANNNNLKRCVILKTLLGTTQTEKDDKCD